MTCTKHSILFCESEWSLWRQRPGSSLPPFLTASSGASQTDNTVALVGGVVAVVIIVAVAVVIVVMMVALLRKHRFTATSYTIPLTLL